MERATTSSTAQCWCYFALLLLLGSLATQPADANHHHHRRWSRGGTGPAFRGNSRRVHKSHAPVPPLPPTLIPPEDTPGRSPDADLPGRARHHGEDLSTAPGERSRLPHHPAFLRDDGSAGYDREPAAVDRRAKAARNSRPFPLGRETKASRDDRRRSSSKNSRLFPGGRETNPSRGDRRGTFTNSRPFPTKPRQSRQRSRGRRVQREKIAARRFPARSAEDKADPRLKQSRDQFWKLVTKEGTKRHMRRRILSQLEDGPHDFDADAQPHGLSFRSRLPDLLVRTAMKEKGMDDSWNKEEKLPAAPDQDHQAEEENKNQDKQEKLPVSMAGRDWIEKHYGNPDGNAEKSSRDPDLTPHGSDDRGSEKVNPFLDKRQAANFFSPPLFESKSGNYDTRAKLPSSDRDEQEKSTGGQEKNPGEERERADQDGRQISERSPFLARKHAISFLSPMARRHMMDREQDSDIEQPDTDLDQADQDEREGVKVNRDDTNDQDKQEGAKVNRDDTESKPTRTTKNGRQKTKKRTWKNFNRRRGRWQMRRNKLAPPSWWMSGRKRTPPRKIPPPRRTPPIHGRKIDSDIPAEFLRWSSRQPFSQRGGLKRRAWLRLQRRRRLWARRMNRLRRRFGMGRYQPKASSPEPLHTTTRDFKKSTADPETSTTAALLLSGESKSEKDTTMVDNITPTSKLADKTTPSSASSDKTTSTSKVPYTTTHTSRQFDKTTKASKLSDKSTHTSKVSDETTHSSKVSHETTPTSKLSDKDAAELSGRKEGDSVDPLGPVQMTVYMGTVEGQNIHAQKLPFYRPRTEQDADDQDPPVYVKVQYKKDSPRPNSSAPSALSGRQKRSADDNEDDDNNNDNDNGNDGGGDNGDDDAGGDDDDDDGTDENVSSEGIGRNRQRNTRPRWRQRPRYNQRRRQGINSQDKDDDNNDDEENITDDDDNNPVASRVDGRRLQGRGRRYRNRPRVDVNDDDNNNDDSNLGFVQIVSHRNSNNRQRGGSYHHRRREQRQNHRRRNRNNNNNRRRRPQSRRQETEQTTSNNDNNDDDDDDDDENRSTNRNPQQPRLPQIQTISVNNDNNNGNNNNNGDDSAEAHIRSPFINHRTAYDFLSSQARPRSRLYGSRPDNEQRLEQWQFAHTMSESMCEVFDKHFVRTSIGGRCE